MDTFTPKLMKSKSETLSVKGKFKSSSLQIYEPLQTYLLYVQFISYNNSAYN